MIVGHGFNCLKQCRCTTRWWELVTTTTTSCIWSVMYVKLSIARKTNYSPPAQRYPTNFVKVFRNMLNMLLFVALYISLTFLMSCMRKEYLAIGNTCTCVTVKLLKHGPQNLLVWNKASRHSKIYTCTWLHRVPITHKLDIIDSGSRHCR